MVTCGLILKPEVAEMRNKLKAMNKYMVIFSFLNNLLSMIPILGMRDSVSKVVLFIQVIM